MYQMNKSQQRAAGFKDGTMLLLAGPGSGKTSVLTHRIKALTDLGVRDSDILVITFTKAAALEMQERFMKLIAPKSANVRRPNTGRSSRDISWPVTERTK